MTCFQVLRGMIAELPSRALTQSEIDRTNRHMDRIESEGKKYAAVVEVGSGEKFPASF